MQEKVFFEADKVFGISAGNIIVWKVYLSLGWPEKRFLDKNNTII